MSLWDHVQSSMSTIKRKSLARGGEGLHPVSYLNLFKNKKYYVTSVDLWSNIIAMEYPSPHILRLYVALFMKEEELYTGEGYVEMDIPWQLCRTIGPLTLHSQEI